jgi:prepilin-type N-terminal cleavage/methylation domain-containing protein
MQQTILHHSRAAFTLLELVFAMVIVSIVLLAIPELLTSALQSIEIGNRQKEIHQTSTLLLKSMAQTSQTIALPNYTPNSQKILTIYTLPFQEVESQGITLKVCSPSLTQRELNITEVQQ